MIAYRERNKPTVQARERERHYARYMPKSLDRIIVNDYREGTLIIERKVLQWST